MPKAPEVQDAFDRMTDYAAKRERSAPPVFVGRRFELNELTSDVQQAVTDNPQGMLRVVQGVPGAGKSALCGAFMASVHGKIFGGCRVLCAQMPLGTLNSSPLSFVSALNDELLRTQAALSGMAGAIGAGRLHTGQMANMAMMLGFKGRSEYKLNNEAHGLTESSPLNVCINAYTNHMWPDDAVVALTFDEMQKCPVTNRSQEALMVLHERWHSARIAVACFGLSNTEAVLREDLGLSRLSVGSVMEIGTLLPGEGRKVLEGTLDHLGMTTKNKEWRQYVKAAGFEPGAWEAWRRTLISDLDRRSGDFPQHLTAALISVCQSLNDNRGSFSPKNDLLQDIAERHEANKASYYRQRLSRPLEYHSIAFGAICRLSSQFKDGAVPWAEAVATVEAGSDKGVPVSASVADEILETSTLNGVMRKGRKASMPHVLPPLIPSTRSHLAARFDEAAAAGHPSALAMRERLRLWDGPSAIS